jgi:hypothetical protein
MNSMGNGGVVNNINQTQFSNDLTRDISRQGNQARQINARPLTRIGLNYSTEVGSVMHQSNRPSDNYESFGAPDNNIRPSNVENQDFNLSKAEQLERKLTSLSWMNGFATLKSTRCYEWDDRELDIIDGVKTVGYLMLILIGTTLFFNGAP